MVQLNCKPSFKHFFLHQLRNFYTCNLKSFTYFLQFGVKWPHVLFKAGWNFWIHRSQSHRQPQDRPRSSGQGVLWWFPVALVLHWGSQPSLGMWKSPSLYLSLCSGDFSDCRAHGSTDSSLKVWAWPWSPRPTGAKYLLQWAVNHPQLPTHLMIWIDKLSPEFLEFNFRNTVIYAERKNT